MDKMKVIRTVVVPLSVAFLFALIQISLRVLDNLPDSFFIISIVILYMIPMAIIINYGFKTQDVVTSILMGVILLPIAWLISGYPNYLSYTSEAIIVIMRNFSVLSVTAGLEGYFAAKRRLTVAILLGGMWILLQLLCID